MKPICLKMRAFGSYGKETVIDFTKPSQNLFLITGDTGSGKSTIFDAIVFALYGQASASDSSKSGLDLQSQYVGVDVEPYVELTFSEMRSGTEQKYRVRRIPRHLKNKRGGGTTDDAEQVELSVLDGTVAEINANKRKKTAQKKETDQEIADIVGLTKEQFMQVAMIAQGDFRRLIKAETKDRKVIFRKIFNTGIYEKSIKEMKVKLDYLTKNINNIKSRIQIIAAGITIPEDYPERSRAEKCKNRIVQDEKWSVVEIEELTEALKPLCEYLSEQLVAAKNKCENTEKQRDNARNELTEAQALIKSFDQLEAAHKTLEECAKRKEEIAQIEKLESNIEKAYGISGVHEQLEKAEKTLKGYNDELKKLKEELPELEKEEKNEENKKNQLNEELSNKRDEFTCIDKDVKDALEIFGKIKDAADKEKKCQESEKKADEEKKKAEKAQSDFEEQLKDWEEEQKQLLESRVP